MQRGLELQASTNCDKRGIQSDTALDPALLYLGTNVTLLLTIEHSNSVLNLGKEKDICLFYELTVFTELLLNFHLSVSRLTWCVK